MFGPSPPPSPTTPSCASNGSPVTLVCQVMKMWIYLPKLVPPYLLTQSHSLSPSRCQNPLFQVQVRFIICRLDAIKDTLYLKIICKSKTKIFFHDRRLEGTCYGHLVKQPPIMHLFAHKSFRLTSI